MTIRVAVEHRTTYRFDRPVRLGPHVVRLRPAPHARTPVRSYALRVEPVEHFVNWQQDPFGNHLARLVFPEPTTELRIDVDVVADLVAINPFDFFIEEAAEEMPVAYDARLAADLAPYLLPDDGGPLVDEALANRVVRAEHQTLRGARGWSLIHALPGRAYRGGTSRTASPVPLVSGGSLCPSQGTLHAPARTAHRDKSHSSSDHPPTAARLERASRAPPPQGG